MINDTERMIQQIKKNDQAYDLITYDENHKLILQKYEDLDFMMQQKSYNEYLKETNNTLYNYLQSQKMKTEILYTEILKQNTQLYSPIESHLLFIQNMLDLKDLTYSKKNVFKEIFFVKVSLNEDVKNKIIESCLLCVNLIPSFYHKNLKEYDLLFGSFKDSYIDPTDKKIYIKLDQEFNIKIICHDFVHELGHIVEYSNSGMLKQNLSFIRNRSVNGNISKKSTHMTYEANEYETNLPKEFQYAGTVYKDSYLSSKKMYTEIVAFGIGMMFINPINFLYSDPDYFHYILKILKQKKASN